MRKYLLFLVKFVIIIMMYIFRYKVNLFILNLNFIINFIFNFIINFIIMFNIYYLHSIKLLI